MKRKHVRAKAGAPLAPQSAQLNAVRKLSHSGRDMEAQERVAELLARFPDFKPLLALAWEVSDNAGNFLSATLHAWDWSKASPGSLAALKALRDSAFDAGLPALAAFAARQLAQAEGGSLPELPPLHGALGDLSFEQAVAVDLSRLFLSYERFSEAIAVLEGIDHPSSRNNLALARFALDDVGPAQEEFETSWRQDARNLFALHHVVRLRLWSGGRVAADELVGALRDAQPLRAEDAYGKISALLLLGMDDETIDAWHGIREAEFWNEENARENSICAYLAGLAALRKGDAKAAGELCIEALDLDPDNLNAESVFTALTFPELGEQLDPKAGDFHDWFPRCWIDEFRSTKGIDAQEATFDTLCRRCKAHADYLAAAAELGGEIVRFLAIAILKARSRDGDSAALDTLRKLLVRPCGPDKVRLDLDVWLQENGFAETGAPQQLLLRGEVRELAFRPMRLHAEQHDLGLPRASQARLEQMHHLLARDDLASALRLAEELSAAHPEHPTLIGNIAGIKEALGQDLDEIESLFRRAAELDPTYLFAQAGLARVAARRGNTERARELLAPLLGREAYHFSEWRAILLAERAVSVSEKDMETVRELDQALISIQEQFG
jgi:tetratricopeptide (TPR) repeat protein